MQKFFTRQFWADGIKGRCTPKVEASQVRTNRREPKQTSLRPCERRALSLEARRQQENIRLLRRFVRFVRSQKGELHDGWLEAEPASENHPRICYYWVELICGGEDRNKVPRSPHHFADCWLSGGRLCFAVYDRRYDNDSIRIALAFFKKTGMPVTVAASRGEHHSLTYTHFTEILREHPVPLRFRESA